MQKFYKASARVTLFLHLNFFSQIRNDSVKCSAVRLVHSGGLAKGSKEGKSGGWGLQRAKGQKLGGGVNE